MYVEVFIRINGYAEIVHFKKIVIVDHYNVQNKLRFLSPSQKKYNYFFLNLFRLTFLQQFNLNFSVKLFVSGQNCSVKIKSKFNKNKLKKLFR